jgi:2-C-methyl-D-erythritol 2,4-cyclodiphosphate synthase
MRVGTGYDSHRFDPDRPLVLGGVHIPEHEGLTGHSDGDAVAHAVIDAILGAAGAGDVGRHFPPGDERWRGADSIGLLERATEILHSHDYRVVNVDVTVVCETPRIGPHASSMARRMAAVMAVGADAVSVKGKSNEGMGWIGRGEGVAVHAVALVDRIVRQSPSGEVIPL